MVSFDRIGLSEPILRAVAAEGYDIPTPIQAQTIPSVLDGRDVLGCAQTGTGKTAAFALPLLHRLAEVGATKGHRRLPRCLVLSPTRELAQQILDSFRTYGRRVGLRHAVIYGGVSQGPQVDAMNRGVDVLVATPGRLLDLIEQGHVDLSCVDSFVLDEADRMLDMGFINDIRRIISYLPQRRQTLLFSATIPPEIDRLASTLLQDPVTVRLAPKRPAASGIEQSVYFVERKNKPKLLARLIDFYEIDRAIVFTRTKYGADKVVRHLRRSGTQAEAIHGNKTQSARAKALDSFRRGRTSTLVATDVASRGIDIDAVSHVINFDLARDPESHVHRIGRTARAGATGIALSFCDTEEIPHLEAIQRFIRCDIPVGSDHWQLTYPTPSLGGGTGSSQRGNKGAKRHGGKGQSAKPASRKSRGRPRHPLEGKGKNTPGGGTRPNRRRGPSRG